jgi:phospholipase/carboxylesterase
MRAKGDFTMLDYQIQRARESAEGAPTVVLLHGRGSDMHDLLQLGPFFPPTWTLVTPRAPFPGMAWGYGPGWAWYRYVAEDRVVDETLAESLERLEEFLGELREREGISAGPLVLGGFSQGGTTATAYALTHPGEVDLVMNLSGFMVSSPLVPVSAEAIGNTEVFWGHGEADPAIPFLLGERGRNALRGIGASVSAFDHPGGHTITREEIEAAVAWVEERTGISPRG